MKGGPSDEQVCRRFATTRWILVLAAQNSQRDNSREALASLCSTYWYPVYAYVRRRGYSAHDAQDLTQEFFAQLLEQKSLAVASRERGKFRSFLLASLNHFLRNRWRRATAQKRGGGQNVISLDLESGERRFALEPSHELTAEKLYQRRWAMTLIEQTLGKLGEEYAFGEKRALFERLRPYLGGEKSAAPYRQLADELQMTEGAIKVAVHRLRRRCRELLRAAIAETVAGPEDVDDELRELFQAVES